MQKDELRERLIELLDEMQSNGVYYQYEDDEGNYLIDFYRSNDDIADHLMYHGVTVQEWIPVSERLPWTDGAPGHNDDFFLVSFTGELQEVECRGFMFTATYDGDGKWSLPFRPYEDVTDGVTHWTVLPEPPKENDDA